MTDKLVLEFEDIGAEKIVKDVGQVVGSIGKLAETVGQLKGTGTAITELRKLFTGLKGSASVVEELKNAVTGLNTAAATMQRGMADSFSRMESVVKLEMDKLVSVVNNLGLQMEANGLKAGKSLNSGIASGISQSHNQVTEALKSNGSKDLILNVKYASDIEIARQQISEKGTSTMLSSLSKRASSIRRILESEHDDRIGYAIKTYGSDFVAVMQKGLAKETEVLALHGETTIALRRAQHEAMIIQGRTQAAEQLVIRKAAAEKLEQEYLREISSLEKLTAKIVKSTSFEGYKNAGPAWWDEQIAIQKASSDKLEQEYLREISSLEKLTAKVVKASSFEG